MAADRALRVAVRFALLDRVALVDHVLAFGQADFDLHLAPHEVHLERDDREAFFTDFTIQALNLFAVQQQLALAGLVVVEDVAEEVRQDQAGFENLLAPMDKEGAYFFLNQNSREPMTEPDEMVPLWKILNTVGADWTYGSKGWAAENYCLFLADNESWKHIIEVKAKAVDDLGCKVWLNTE